MSTTTSKLDQFTRAYAECALWSSHDNSDDSGGEPLDANYGIEDIAPETLARMAEDCLQFRADNAGELARAKLSDSRAGFLFWLNRNRHGSGFWDEYNGADEELRAAYIRLSEASRVWGTVDLYVGDDGLIYA